MNKIRGHIEKALEYYKKTSDFELPGTPSDQVKQIQTFLTQFLNRDLQKVIPGIRPGILKKHILKRADLIRDTAQDIYNIKKRYH